MEKKTKLIIAGVFIGVLLIAAVWLNTSTGRGPNIPQKEFDEAAKIANEPEPKPAQ